MNFGVILTQELSPLKTVLTIVYGVGCLVSFIWLLTRPKDDEFTLLGRIVLAAFLAFLVPILFPLILLIGLIFSKPKRR
jgi:hypothetical protein